MKWYSVKKYKPPFGSYKILLSRKGGGYLIGSYDESYIEKERWSDDEDGNININDFSHFALFEPIEIEE